MSELKLDEATLILFLPLILFSPDRRDLDDRKRVYQIQSKYSFLLKKYMIWKFGFNGATIKLYNKLLLKLMELRTLQEMHSSILLDADPSRLEPFSLALITSHKEENSKFKSNENKEPDEDHTMTTTSSTPSNTGLTNTNTDTNAKITHNSNIEDENDENGDVKQTSTPLDEPTIVDEDISGRNSSNHAQTVANTIVASTHNASSTSNPNIDTNAKPNSNCQLNNNFSDMSVLTPVSMISSVTYSGQISSISSVSSQNHNQTSPPHSNENNYSCSTFETDCS